VVSRPRLVADTMEVAIRRGLAESNTLSLPLMCTACRGMVKPPEPKLPGASLLNG
jgi:hypothetical protein